MEIKKIPPKVAARIMGKSVQYVRCGLQAGKFPFGTAFKGTGDIYNYYISPKLFMDYTGCTLGELRSELDETETADAAKN